MCLCVCTCECVCVHVHICMYVWSVSGTRVCVHSCMYMHVCVCVSVSVFVCSYVHMYVRVFSVVTTCSTSSCGNFLEKKGLEPCTNSQGPRAVTGEPHAEGPCSGSSENKLLTPAFTSGAVRPRLSTHCSLRKWRRL